jgi:predicted neuraminidase
MKRRWIAVVLAVCGSAMGLVPAKATQATNTNAAPFLTSELIFPLEHWHNHASSIVETPRGDLLVCWFHGSGERTADDVVIQGARLEKGSRQWGERFLMADTPGYPDTNATLFIDPQQRLWLFWPTILANQWESALMKYKRAPTAEGGGPPSWDTSDVLHVTPGNQFESVTDRVTDEWRATAAREARADAEDHVSQIRQDAANKLTRRLGWMTRAHPVVLDGTRLVVPLYSDGFSFSLMAISDDWGKTWKTSTPLVGAGNIQPSIARRKDGTLVTYMRDNGPPPKRLMMSTSTDRGETWSPVVDSEFFNPGSGAEVVGLRNGHWVLVYNDLEQGRYSLAVSLSEDEGRTWPWTRHLERHPPKGEGREYWGEYHYPSLIEARDGTLHVSYSYFQPPAESKRDAENRPVRKSIKHAHFNEAWIKQGDQ